MLIKKYLLTLVTAGVFVFLSLNICILYAQTIPVPNIKFSPRNYVCFRTDEKINIDGKLDDSVWQKAVWSEFFTDIEGNLKPSPRYNTRIKMLWGKEFLYIGAELEEPDIWATLKKRDTVIYNDNDFEVFIDPDGDTQNYYEFEINAFNTPWDLLLTKPYRMGGAAVNAWDIQGLVSAVSCNGTLNKTGDRDRNWTVEIAFPWKVLMQCAGHKGLPVQGEQWRLNFSRVEWKTDTLNGKYFKTKNTSTNRSLAPDNWVWSPQGLVDMHYPEMWGYLQFSEKAAGTSDDKYIQKPEENAKWICRQILYKEYSFYTKHGKFTNSLNELDIQKENIPGYQWPPVVETISDYFEVSMISQSGKEKVRLTADGKVVVLNN